MLNNERDLVTSDLTVSYYKLVGTQTFCLTNEPSMSKCNRRCFLKMLSQIAAIIQQNDLSGPYWVLCHMAVHLLKKPTVSTFSCPRALLPPVQFDGPRHIDVMLLHAPSHTPTLSALGFWNVLEGSQYRWDLHNE